MYRVFLSSPGDVLLERNRAQAVIDRLNAQRPSDPLFSITRWEQSYYSATATFQDQILSPGDHDLVVFIFWKRLGTDLPAAYNRADGTSRTGTEYEFEDARDARERRSDHLPDMLVYRKTAKILFSEDSVDIERAQKKALDQFWERWFRTDTGHFIAGFQSFADADDFETQLERNLTEWLRRHQTNSVIWDVRTQGSPYRGLAPYDESHASLFFGREVDIGQARARFIEAAIGQQSGRRGTPFLLILGASGSGKSSFLRAGLLPRLRDEGVPAFLEDGSDAISNFRTLVLMPREMGEDLCRGLAAALFGTRGSAPLPELAEGDYSPETLADLASSSPEAITVPVLRALDRAGAKSEVEAPQRRARTGLLLAIDQLEELFARPEADRQMFVRLLSALAATGRVWIAATMRNDFYDRLRLEAALSNLVDRGRIYNLAPPGTADFRDIVRKPAQAAGLVFESNERRHLAAEIESEASGEGALPMVAFLLDQMFRERREDVLTFDTYDRLGGAAGALAHHGDQVFLSLPAPVQAAFPRVVRRLVRKSLKDLAPTATSAALNGFAEGSPERVLINALSEARLVQLFTVLEQGSSSPQSWVRWSHEALLTRWPRLRTSVDADRRDYETLDRLQSDYSLWQGSEEQQKSGRLLSGLALAEAADLVERWGADVDAALRNFVFDSQDRYRAQRRRKRRTITATVTALALLTIAASVASVVAFRQRDKALLQQAAAIRTTQFMVSLFENADPDQNRGDTITVREVLDKGAQDAEKSLEHQPALRADILTAMGGSYSGLGKFETAKTLLAQAMSDQHGTESLDESRVRTLSTAGLNLYLAGEYPQSEALLLQAVALAREELPRSAEDRINAFNYLTDVEIALQKYKEAQQLNDETVAASRLLGPNDGRVLANSLGVKGDLNVATGDLKAAEAAMQEALELHMKYSGPQSARTATLMNNLSTVYYFEGKYADNVAILKRALPIYLHVYGPEHPQVATLTNNLGRTTLMLGNVAEAAPLLRQALAINEKNKGADDFMVPPLNSLAMIDGYSGKLTEANAEIARAEKIARQPNNGQLLDQVLLNVADLALRSGHPDAAAKPLDESQALLKAAHPLDQQPAEAWRYAVWDTVNAESLAHAGKIAEARAAIAAAIPIIDKRYGPRSFYNLLAQRRLEYVNEQERSALPKR
jgi:Tetratricopeptide repeat